MKVAVVLSCAVPLLIGVIAGWHGPMAGDDAALLQVPTILLLAAIVCGVCRGWLDLAGFSCAALFLAVHTVAAYYGYCNVPYDDWLDAICEIRASSFLGSDRNHFDRLVHFCYGLFLLLPVRQIAACLLGVRGLAATWIAVEFILASSLLYEVAEWLIAVCMSPDFADRYNGQQGDYWDAQKDMELATCGALIAAVWLTVRSIDLRREHDLTG